MSLPKWLTTVTPLSKYVALSLFITLPLLSFYLGAEYQKQKVLLRKPLEKILPSPTLMPTIVFNDKDSYFVYAQENSTDSKKSDIYLKNLETNKEQLYTTLNEIYTNHYHVGEYHNGNLYIIKRIGYDEYPDEIWTDELWRYDSQLHGQKLYSDKGLDFRVSPDEKYIALWTNEVLVLLSSNGDVIRSFPKKNITISKLFPGATEPLESSLCGLTDWDRDGFWLDCTFGPSLMGFVKIDFNTFTITKYDLTDLQPGPEYDLNPQKMKVVYSNYPALFEEISGNEYLESKAKVTLSVYDLQSKTIQSIATSITKEFNPKWIDENTIEYDDPNGNARIKKTIE